MKRLLIACSAASIAVMSNAASIDWASAYNYVTDKGVVQTAATAADGNFVLCYLGTTADGYNWDNPSVVNVGSVSYASVKGVDTAKALGKYTWTYGAADTPINGDVFGVMFQDAGGNLSSLVTTDGAEIQEAFTINGMNNDTYSGSLTFASSDYTTAVPEPTSGLLLVLGMAGLALKRKRA